MMTPTTPQADLRKIRRALAVLLPGGGVTELRVLHTTSGGTVSGYFDDLDALATAAAQWSGEAPGVYITLNPVMPALLARAANRVQMRARHTTADADIERRAWLPIDIDPNRPAGISSTDTEHAAALACAREVRDWLRPQGFPEPVFADSGNGAHLLYRIELPNDDDSRELVQHILSAIAFRFSTTEITIDTSVGNAGRIWKIYGTLAAKGDATPERPHRIARMLEVPKTLDVVSLQALRAVGDLVPKPPESTTNRQGGGKLDVAAWLGEHGVAVGGSGPWQGGHRWVLDACPWNPEHTDRSAYVVQLPSGAIGAGCHHSGCTNNDWHSLRDIVEPGWRNASGSTGGSAQPSVADRLVEIGQETELFHDEVDSGFARLNVSDHAEIQPLRGKNFKRWLRLEYFARFKKAPTREGIDAALGVLEALAVFKGERYELHNRVARVGDDFWYDLADESWQAVKVGSVGWSIVPDPPIVFRRYVHQQPQREPTGKGDLRLVLRFLNIRPEDELLLLTWLVTAFVPGIAHPIPDFHGEKGSGKTFGQRVLRRIIDPSAMASLTFPTELKELVQQLMHNYCPIFDNVDALAPWLSDALCRAVTGEGFSKRELYSDDDDVIYQYRRVILLNGINVSAQRPDLLDRSILLRLVRIPKSQRRLEAELLEEFEIALPRILAGIFDTLSAAMQVYPTLNLNRLERMADFTRWGAAVAEALGDGAQAFLDAYSNNVSVQSQEAIEGNLVGSAIVALMDNQPLWTGSPTELLLELEYAAVAAGLLRKPPGGGAVRQRGWPGGPHILSRRLNEIRSNLLDVGIEVTETKSNTRQITIQRQPGPPGGPSAGAPIGMQHAPLAADPGVGGAGGGGAAGGMRGEDWITWDPDAPSNVVLEAAGDFSDDGFVGMEPEGAYGAEDASRDGGAVHLEDTEVAGAAELEWEEVPE